MQRTKSCLCKILLIVLVLLLLNAVTFCLLLFLSIFHSLTTNLKVSCRVLWILLSISHFNSTCIDMVFLCCIVLLEIITHLSHSHTTIGACSAVERKLSPVFSSFLVVYEVMRAVISVLSVVLVFFIVFLHVFITGNVIDVLYVRHRTCHWCLFEIQLSYQIQMAL